MIGDRSPAAGASHAVLYDSDCGFCKWALNKILAWDRHGRLRPVAIQGEEGQRLLAAIPEAQRLDSWHLVRPTGEVVSAGAAAPELARLLPGGRVISAVLRISPAGTERAYRWVAGNRDRLAARLRIDARCEVRR